MEKNDMRDDTLKIYEIGYLIVPTVAEENIAAEVQAMKAVLESKGAQFITEDSPKIRPLSYVMTKVIGSQHSKYDKAYFGWIKFEIAPNAVPLVKTELDKNEKILRSMIIETVRENTMVSAKVVFRPTDGKSPVGTDTVPAKVSQEEIDKTIETLIVE